MAHVPPAPQRQASCGTCLGEPEAMTSEERIEAVRRVMCCGTLCWAHRDPSHCEARQNVDDEEVKAVLLVTLQSLREPGDKIIFAGHSGYEGDHQHGLTDEMMLGAWRAMIDTAIKEAE